MRTYTLAFSIVVHAFLVAALVIAPLVANTVLPEPRYWVKWHDAIPVSVEDPPPPRGTRRTTGERPSVTRKAAPMEPPSGVTPEPTVDPTEEGDVPGVTDGDPFGIVGGVETNRPADPPPPPLKKPLEPVRISQGIRPPQKVRHVPPAYPQIAQAAGVQGTVILEAVIGEDGRVRNLRVLRSIPLLDRAAIDAVRQWQFTPTLLNAEPVAVVMTVTVTFTLQR